MVSYFSSESKNFCSLLGVSEKLGMTFFMVSINFEGWAVRKIADGEEYKMPATIDDPAILNEIKEDLKKHNILKS